MKSLYAFISLISIPILIGGSKQKERVDTKK